jgi:hypothetical protein
VTRLLGLSIRTKVTGVIVCTCALLLVATLAVVVRTYWLNARSQHVEALHAAAGTVGGASAPAQRVDDEGPTASSSSAGSAPGRRPSSRPAPGSPGARCASARASS